MRSDRGGGSEVGAAPAAGEGTGGPILGAGVLRIGLEARVVETHGVARPSRVGNGRRHLLLVVVSAADHLADIDRPSIGAGEDTGFFGIVRQGAPPQNGATNIPQNRQKVKASCLCRNEALNCGQVC